MARILALATLAVLLPQCKLATNENPVPSIDAFVANWSSSVNRVYLNDGSGSFTGSDATSDTHNSYDVALGDLDEDGDLDAFVANQGQVNRVYLNDGSGSFIGSDATSDTHNSFDVALGDLDGDGDLDAFIANCSSQINRVYLNDGSGSFIGSDATTDAHESYGVALGDLDGK